MLYGLLRGEEMVKNCKHTYRSYIERGFQIRNKKRKKLIQSRQSMEMPTEVNQRWSMDFVSSQLRNGRRFRILNVVDDNYREKVWRLVSVSISGRQFAKFLSLLVE